MTILSSEDVLRILDLQPHPEGGAYRETYRSKNQADVDPQRSVCTAIYFLVQAHQKTEWHRVKYDEMYHHYAGTILDVLLISPDGVFEKHKLGDDLETGARPQLLIPGGYWQSVQAHDFWVLVGCTVSPGFDFSDFELSNEAALKKQFPHLSF